MNYYNTTNESGDQLQAFKKKTETQANKILEFFKDQPAVEYGASSIHLALFGHDTPITSVRRSITNLVDNGKLEYSGRMRKGNYGRNEKLIKLK
jgi:hypothetical protein